MSVVGALQTLSNPKAIPGLTRIAAWTQSFDLCWKWNNRLLILPLSGHSDDTDGMCCGEGGLEGRIHRNKKGSRKINGGPPTVTLRRTHSCWYKAVLEWHLGAHKRLLCLQRKKEQGRLWEGRGSAQRDEGKAWDDINPARCHHGIKDAHR